MSTLTKPQARAIHALLVTLGPDARSDIVIEFNDTLVTLTASHMVIIQAPDGNELYHGIEKFALTYNLDDPALT